MGSRYINLKKPLTGLAFPFRSLRVAILACGLVATACEKKRSAAPAARASPVRVGTGTIQGTVTLAGKSPAMAPLANQPCHDGAKPIRDESVVASDDGRLQNVIVYLEDAPPAAPAGDLPPLVLDQIDCRYVPHVVALRTGQTLTVTTHDATLHNVHGMCTVNDAFNFALVAPGQSHDLRFAQGELFPIRCDVHPWMKAWVRVFEHPYFAVTGRDGRFEIRNVPPGSYTLVAWQEKYGTLRAAVTAIDTRVGFTSFTFQSGL
jgi:plastocyanin